jgi:hypothetical protein
MAVPQLRVQELFDLLDAIVQAYLYHLDRMHLVQKRLALNRISPEKRTTSMGRQSSLVHYG